MMRMHIHMPYHDDAYALTIDGASWLMTHLNTMTNLMTNLMTNHGYLNGYWLSNG